MEHFHTSNDYSWSTHWQWPSIKCIAVLNQRDIRNYYIYVHCSKSSPHLYIHTSSGHPNSSLQTRACAYMYTHHLNNVLGQAFCGRFCRYCTSSPQLPNILWFPAAVPHVHSTHNMHAQSPFHSTVFLRLLQLEALWVSPSVTIPFLQTFRRRFPRTVNIVCKEVVDAYCILLAWHIVHSLTVCSHCNAVTLLPPSV